MVWFRNMSCSWDEEDKELGSRFDLLTQCCLALWASSIFFTSASSTFFTQIECTVVLRVEQVCCSRSVDILLVFTQSPYKLYHHLRMAWYFVNTKFLVIAVGRPCVLKKQTASIIFSHRMLVQQGYWKSAREEMCKTEIDLAAILPENWQVQLYWYQNAPVVSCQVILYWLPCIVSRHSYFTYVISAVKTLCNN